MLQICSPVKNFFYLILEISVNFFVVAIQKSLGISQASIKKCFKLISNDQNRVFCSLFLFILLLIKADLIPKKRRIKKNLVDILGSSKSKVVFTQLTKVIAFYMEFTIIHI